MTLDRPRNPGGRFRGEAVALDIVRRPEAGSYDLQYLRLAVARQHNVADPLAKERTRERGTGVTAFRARGRPGPR
jgi:hypothetical protein